MHEVRSEPIVGGVRNLQNPNPHGPTCLKTTVQIRAVPSKSDLCGSKPVRICADPDSADPNLFRDLADR